MVEEVPEDNYHTRLKHVCERLPHQLEGRWQIGDRKYWPTWPKGNLDSEDLSRTMVKLGIKSGQEYYQRTKHSPSSILVQTIGNKTSIKVKK